MCELGMDLYNVKISQQKYINMHMQLVNKTK